MGQYHKILNVTKRETFGFGGVKLWEHVGDPTAAAFLLLLCNSNGRGGGDFSVSRHAGFVDNKWVQKPLSVAQEKQQKAIEYLQGRWIGDTIVVQGDYADLKDPSFEPNLEGYENITALLWTALPELDGDK